MDAFETSPSGLIESCLLGAGTTYFGPSSFKNILRLRSASTMMAKELRSSATSGELLSSAPPDLQPVYIGERLRCEENGSVRILWKNIYLFTEHRRYRIQYEDVRFRIVDGPLHGQVLLNDSVVHEFSYEDIINQRIVYVHDGSETLEDSMDLKVNQIEVAYQISNIPGVDWRTRPCILAFDQQSPHFNSLSPNRSRGRFNSFDIGSWWRNFKRYTVVKVKSLQRSFLI